MNLKKIGMIVGPIALGILSDAVSTMMMKKEIKKEVANYMEENK